LRHLEDNPLPVLIIVSPGGEALSAEVAGQLQRELQAMAGVDEAVLDMAWVQRLNALMALAQRFVLALGLLFALGVLLIVGNTIRLAIENRRDEIVVVKLVGGSDAFVRRPFMYTGLWYGLGGAVLAWFIVALALWGLRAPLAELASLYQSSFALRGLSATRSLLLLAAGSGLGLLGAWLAVARHLTAIQPR
jgi:cell division transport system permease protein